MHTWTCPTCSAPNPPPKPSDPFVCQYCLAELGETAIVCPGCGQVWQDTLESCPSCAEPLSAFARVMYRHEQAGQPPRWLAMARQQATAVKTQQSVESERRMQVFHEHEQQRLEQLRQDEAARRARDEQTISVAFVIGGSVLVLLILVGLALALGT